MNPSAFEPFNTINATSLPLGNLLLNQEDKDYPHKLAKLERVQEILEDFALENSKQVEINAKLAVIYANEQGVIPQIVRDFESLAQEFFEVLLLPLESLDSFSGQFGGFSAYLDNNEVAEFAQAVLFVSEEELLRFRGVYNVADFKNPESLLEKLKANLGVYSYKEMISFQEKACQYHHRREEHCLKCVEVCPTFGVSNNGDLMELAFSPIDCIACGACVGVCPTNCLECEELPKEALDEILEFYKGEKVFLCSRKDYENLISQNKHLPSDFIPLILPNLLLLNENDLLSIVQTSGYALVAYTPHLSAAMRFLNNITQQIYQCDYILQTTSLESLESKALPKIETYLYKNRRNKPYRESFAQRLQYMVKDKDYGLAKSVQGAESLGLESQNVESQNVESQNVESQGAGLQGAELRNLESQSAEFKNIESQKDSVLYGEIQIDSSKCTLCLSCVGACNVNAIFAREEDFSLRFNASLCTTCGYCVASCPEADTMSSHKNGIYLNPNWFKSKELAKDEPFSCVECGNVFSTKKSIDKVVSMLGDSFANDEKKLKTLQCCPDCKVRVMLGA